MSLRLSYRAFSLVAIYVALVGLTGCGPEQVSPTPTSQATTKGTKTGEITTPTPARSVAIGSTTAHSAEDYVNLGIAAQNEGDYDQAIAYYDQAIQLDPTSATSFFDRATAYDGTGDDKKAVEDYTQAIRLKPDYEVAYYGRGTANLYLGKYDDAISDFDHSIKFKPINVRSYTNRCIAYYHKKKYAQAESDCTKAIKQSDPSDEYMERTYDTRARVYQAKHEPKLAIDDYSRAVQIDPGFWQSYLSRADAYREIGEKEKAIADYRKVVELSTDPDSREEARKQLAALGVK